MAITMNPLLMSYQGNATNQGRLAENELPSEEELRIRFFDEGFDNFMSLDQFFINQGRPDLAQGRKLSDARFDSGKITDKDLAQRFDPGKITDKDLAQAQSQGKMLQGLAGLGRFGDSYMVHATEGETFIPEEVLNDNPELKEDLFNQMRSMGADPERYTVGNGVNSINPMTGQPEFFFKKIGKMLKKAAPIIGSVVGFAVGGPSGAAIGSGLGSLAGGKSAEEALLNAGLSFMGGKYLTPSISKGLQGMGVGTSSLGSNVGQGIAGMLGKNAGQPLANILAAGGTALLTDQTAKGLGSMFETPSGEAMDPNEYTSVVDEYYAELAAHKADPENVPEPALPAQLTPPPQDQLIQPVTMADIASMNFNSAQPIDYEAMLRGEPIIPNQPRTMGYA